MGFSNGSCRFHPRALLTQLDRVFRRAQKLNDDGETVDRRFRVIAIGESSKSYAGPLLASTGCIQQHTHAVGFGEQRLYDLAAGALRLAASCSMNEP
jgi:hypothetical protein